MYEGLFLFLGISYLVGWRC